jgi:hypothetical protein
MTKNQVLERAMRQLPLLRVNAGAVVQARLLSAGPMWLKVHWIGGRQVLCTGDDEEFCAGCCVSGSRVTGFVLATLMMQERERLFLLELSPGSWSRVEFLMAAEKLSRERGLWCEITRSRQRAPLRIEPTEESTSSYAPVNLQIRLLEAVAILYGLPFANYGESIEAWETRIRPMLVEQMSRALAKQVT